jgi:protein-S-isoprenylcysteine O-methyltransferase Ste14
MFLFLVPILLGFSLTSASSFTGYYSRWFGERGGRIACVVLRDVLGIPMWSIGYIMAVQAPSTLLFSSIFFTSGFGWIFSLAGGAIIIAGFVSIRWRALAPSVQDTLVMQGIYAYIRHPLYIGMSLELIGLFLLIPSITVLVACVLGIVWVRIQARLEEMDLVQRMPAYQEYMQQVPRFVPKFRLHKT